MRQREEEGQKEIATDKRNGKLAQILRRNLRFFVKKLDKKTECPIFWRPGMIWGG